MDFKKVSGKVTNYLLDDDYRKPFLILILSAFTSIITLISAVPHFLDDAIQEGEWLMATILAAAFVISTIIFLLTFFDRKHYQIYSHILMAMIIMLFGYCCWDGGPKGFIHLWVLIVPAFSFVTFGIFEGFLIAIPVLIVMCLFFWTPLNQYIKFPGDLSIDFMLRMTLVYIVGVILGFIAELLRHVAARKLQEFNKHYEYISLHDSLTGLANQNYLGKYLENIYENKDKFNNMGCLFIDVDGFKGVNDKYGHLFGNVVLVKIGEILALEKEAFVCRWGGDEFVVCLTNIDEDYLVRIGEKFRASVAACSFPDIPHFHITISVGAVVILVDEEFNFDHVLDLADSANRAAKKKGKDNVSLSE